MNTRIVYEYRDASNYHFHGEVIIAGEMTTEYWERIRATCEDREFFIAHQVRLPEVFGFLPGPHIHEKRRRHTGYPFDPEDDHCWHRFGADPGCWKITKAVRTDPRSVLLLVRSFEKAAKSGWKVFDPEERLGL